MSSPILSETAIDIVKEALLILKVIDAELPIESVDQTNGLNSLNRMIKQWQAQGFHLWTETEAVLFLQQGVSKYSFGVDCNSAIHDDYDTDTVTADYVASSLLLQVNNGAFYSDGDSILITLDSGLKFETTVVSVLVNDVTIADEPTDAVSAGNDVILNYSYISRPLSITNLRFREAGQQTDIPTWEWARKEYFEQPDKESQGTVSTWYYSPQLNCGDLYVWQTPASNNQQARFTFIRPTEISTSNASLPDFPSEWFLTLAYNLAATVAPQYQVPVERMQMIEQKAAIYLDESLGFDNEDTYITFEPEHTR